MHRHVRRVGDEFALVVEDRAGEVEPLLDVDGVGGLLERQPHLLGDVHEEVVEDLEHDRVGVGADGMPGRCLARPREDEVRAPGEGGLPAVLDHGGVVRLDDEGRAFDLLPGLELQAVVDVAVVPLAVRIDLGLADGARRRLDERHGRLAHFRSPADAFDGDGLDHQVLLGRDEAELPLVRMLEGAPHPVGRVEWYGEVRVGSGIAQVDVGVVREALRRHALAGELGRVLLGEPLGGRLHFRHDRRGERLLDRLLAVGADVGKPHPVGRQHAGQRVDEDRLHAQHVGDEAGVLRARAPEAVEHVGRDVVPALDRDLLDRVGHVVDGDLDEPVGDLGRRALVADLLGECRERDGDALGVERLVAAAPENLREVLGMNLADHDVRVGDGQRTAAPIGEGTRIGACRIRPDAEPRPVIVQDRPAARRHGMNAHHRRPHADARHLRVEGALELAVEMRDVGRRAAHVEADDAPEAGHAAGLHHADDTAGRAGEDGVLALEQPGRGQAARRHHEHEPRPALAGLERESDLVDVAAQDRREVGVDDRRVAAPHELHERRDLVRHRHLREADGAGELGDLPFVIVVPVGVHEDDGAGADALVVGGPQLYARGVEIEGRQHRALRVDALSHFDDFAVEEFRLDDVAVEEARPRLVADLERVAEAFGDDEDGGVAGPFEQRVGRDRRAHLDGGDGVGRDRFPVGEVHQLAYAFDGGVGVGFRIVRQELVGDDRALGRTGHDIRERAPAVDPEVPFARLRLAFRFRHSRPRPYLP